MGEMDSKFTPMQASCATEFPVTTAMLKDKIKWTLCSSNVTMMVSTVAQQKQIEERACKEKARPFRLHELCRWKILKCLSGKRLYYIYI
jgi:hypothetical protein